MAHILCSFELGGVGGIYRDELSVVVFFYQA